MGEYLKFFEATTKPMEEYLVWLKKNGYSSDRTTTPEEDRRLIQSEITDMLFKDSFFKTTLISAVMNTNFDIRPYKNLNFDEALNYFNTKKLGDPNSIVEEYEDGWRWVDAGSKCELVGSELANCGSVGVMSDDPDRTMLVLLNPQLTPKVVATYSPNQKRISQVQGRGSTEPDSAYYDYILRLSKKLNAPLLERRLDGKNFKIWLYVATESEPELFNAGYFNNIYKFTMPDGRVWYSDSNYFIEESNLFMAADILAQDEEVQKNIQKLREMNNLPEDMDKYHSVLAFGDAYDHALKGKMPEDWKLGQGRFEDLYQIPKIQRF